MYDCIALGEILVDFISDKKNAVGYPVLEGNPGGGPPNFIVACAKLNLKTALVAKVGDDMFGCLLQETLAQYGVENKYIAIDSDHFTTLAFVNLSDNGERTFSFSRKCSADIMLSMVDLPMLALKKCRSFHFSSLSMVMNPSYSATLKAITWVKEAGGIIHFDPNYRKSLWPNLALAKQRILEGIALCDVLKISEYELSLIEDKAKKNFDKEALISLAQNFFKKHNNLKLMHLTMGKNGVYIRSKMADCFIKAPEVKAVDTTGAGDTYGAAALCALLNSNKGWKLLEDDLLKIGLFATRAAAFSVMRYGGIPSSPYLSEIEKI